MLLHAGLAVRPTRTCSSRASRPRALAASLGVTDRTEAPFAGSSARSTRFCAAHSSRTVSAQRRSRCAARCAAAAAVPGAGVSDAHLTADISFFDLDGTLCDSNSVKPFFLVQLRQIENPVLKALFVLHFAFKVVLYICMDKVDRNALLRLFYRNYAGCSTARKEADAAWLYQNYFAPRIYATAVAHIAEIRRRGGRVVVVTGSLDFVIAPVAAALGADDVVATRLEEQGGEFTGRTVGPPMNGQEKARAVSSYANVWGVPLERCAAYGDSRGDAEMLRAVGAPLAVNPDSGLKKLCETTKWPIANWAEAGFAREASAAAGGASRWEKGDKAAAAAAAQQQQPFADG